VSLLAQGDLDAALAQLPGWRLRDGKLAATWRFADFRAAFAFMQAFAADAEQSQHHPDWSNVYAHVTVAFVTHDAGGITARDVAMAQRAVERAQQHGGALVPPPPTPPRPRDLPPHWLMGSIAVMVALHWLSPGPRWLAFPWTLGGVAVAALGLLVMVASAGMFRRLGTGVRPFTPATVLVARGPFRVSRNPMYLGMVLMLVGLGMALGTTVPLLVPPLFAVVIDRRFIRREEEFLADRFGAPYREFCGRVRRWL